jgi:predicted MFS family arabinose efflux permease
MPGRRALLLAAAVGVGVGTYFALWFRWPAFLAIAIGATMGVILLLMSASLGDDPTEADAAWRAAAPDLAARERAATRATQPAPDAEPGER